MAAPNSIPISRDEKLRRIVACQALQTSLAFGGVQSRLLELTFTVPRLWRSPALAAADRAKPIPATMTMVVRFMTFS